LRILEHGHGADGGALVVGRIVALVKVRLKDVDGAVQAHQALQRGGQGRGAREEVLVFLDLAPVARCLFVVRRIDLLIHSIWCAENP
jgi:hypothetical protein